MDEIDLARIRRTYAHAQLSESAMQADPIRQFQDWLREALEASVREPNAMCLCTVAGVQPSARIVLLRGLDHRGLVFFTSYFSRKAEELARNPHAAAVFFWPELERQVRVEGNVERISDQESDAYFAGRPRGHQLGAWASEQSQTVESRQVLDQRMEDYAQRFEGEDVPRPHSWGGMLIDPATFEFWQGRPNRMHDRIQYLRRGAAWTIRRLQP